jgi:hypothetical protein
MGCRQVDEKADRDDSAAYRSVPRTDFQFGASAGGIQREAVGRFTAIGRSSNVPFEFLRALAYRI